MMMTQLVFDLVCSAGVSIYSAGVPIYSAGVLMYSAGVLVCSAGVLVYSAGVCIKQWSFPGSPYSLLYAYRVLAPSPPTLQSAIKL